MVMETLGVVCNANLGDEHVAFLEGDDMLNDDL
jgi:hypothetical protein